MEVLIKLSDAIKTLKSMAVPLVRKLPSAQPERLTDYSFEESCTECPAYDTENHRCPRFNQVIRTALKDANLEPCENCISRQAAIDVADAVWSVTGDKNVAKVWDQIKDLPSVQPEIIHCKECKYGVQDEDKRWYCRGLGCQVGEADGSGFCADAERRTKDEDTL